MVNDEPSNTECSMNASNKHRKRTNSLLSLHFLILALLTHITNI